MFTQFWNDEAGFIVSAELILIATLLVLGLIVGLSEVEHAVVAELNDVADGIGALNQSYADTGFAGTGSGGGKSKSFYAGSRFDDATDDCDLNTTCDLVTGTTAVTASESVTP